MNKEQNLITEEEPIPEEYKDLIIPNQNNISENNPNNLKPKVVISSNPQINNITMINNNMQVQNLNTLQSYVIYQIKLLKIFILKSGNKGIVIAE